VYADRSNYEVFRIVEFHLGLCFCGLLAPHSIFLFFSFLLIGRSAFEEFLIMEVQSGREIQCCRGYPSTASATKYTYASPCQLHAYHVFPRPPYLT
jgi:hypothetical protein